MNQLLHDMTRRRDEDEITVRGRRKSAQRMYLAADADVQAGDVLIDAGQEFDVRQVIPVQGYSTVHHQEADVRVKKAKKKK